jgi:hypothetical protein
VFWKDIGERMGIKDIPDTIIELKAWTLVGFFPFYAYAYLRLNLHLSFQAYEEQYMVPAVTNRDLAGYTTDELLRAVPEAFGLKALARRMVVCLVDERPRIAMMCVCLSHSLVTTLLIFKIQGFRPNPWFYVLSSNLQCKP